MTPRLRVVVDANVWVSALADSGIVPRTVVAGTVSRYISMISDDVIDQVHRALLAIE